MSFLKIMLRKLLIFSIIPLLLIIPGIAFGEKIFKEIIITDESEQRFGNLLTLTNDKLFVIFENQILIYNSNNGDYEKSIPIKNFQNENLLYYDANGGVAHQKQTISGDYIFVQVKIDPYFSKCDSGIAMINYKTGDLNYLFTDIEFLGYEYGGGVGRSFQNFTLEEQICAHNFGRHFEVYDNYLLVTIPHEKGKYNDGGERDYIQKAQVVLFDIKEKKILKIFDDVDFTEFIGLDHPEGKKLYVLDRTDFGSSLAINSQYIVIGVDHQVSISVYDLKSKELVTKIEAEKFKDRPMGFGKSIALIDNYLFVSQPGWDSGRILQYELPSGELKRIIRSPSSIHYNFGTELTAGVKSVFVSQYDSSRYVNYSEITEDQRENIRGKVFQYDVDSGNLVQEFKNNSDTPGNFWRGNLWTDSFGQIVSFVDDKIAISATGFDKGAVFLFLPTTLSEKDISNTIKDDGKKEFEEQPSFEKPKLLGIAGFVDKSKDPKYYIDRYNKEPAYKEWFHKNYPQYDSIEQAVGLELTEKVPDWVKNIFGWYANDQVSEDELLNAIRYLINQGILVVN